MGNAEGAATAKIAVRRNTARELARQFGVSERTIYNNARFSVSVDAICEVLGPEAKRFILHRDVRLTRSQVESLAYIAQHDPELARDLWAKIKQAQRGPQVECAR